MDSRIPKGFIEVRTGKKCIYIKKGFPSLSDYLTRNTYPWSEAQEENFAETTAHEGRGPISILVLSTEGKERAVIKHYQRGGLFRHLLHDLYLGAKRFFVELGIVERATALGIPTAEVLALVLQRSGLFFYRADLVTREIPDSVNLADYLGALFRRKGRTDFLVVRRQLLSLVASLLRKMHYAGIYHADLNLKNILIQETADTLKCHIIDLDRARYQVPLGNKQRLSNLMRLYRSLEKIGYMRNPVTADDISEFVELYCQDEPELEQRCRKLLRRPSLSLRLHRVLWRINRAVRG